MFTLDKVQYDDKKSFYEMMLKQLSSLLEGETDSIANLSNTSALLRELLDEINWVGFYLLKDDELVLGPFQGKVACVRIKNGRGVCGTAALEDKTQVVVDVHTFPGHIACDSASKSEIVIPMHKGEKVIGVLDIDSPIKGRFDELDACYLEKLVKILEESCEW
ncbi:MAG: GAF domain-containing protein [Cellulosilyticaceae bacterium]